MSKTVSYVAMWYVTSLCDDLEINLEWSSRITDFVETSHATADNQPTYLLAY